MRNDEKVLEIRYTTSRLSRLVRLVRLVTLVRLLPQNLEDGNVSYILANKIVLKTPATISIVVLTWQIGPGAYLIEWKLLFNIIRNPALTR